MTNRVVKQVGQVLAGTTVALAAWISTGAGSATADTSNPIDTSAVTQTVANLDLAYQNCELQRGIDLTVIWAESYPSQPPLPGFCVAQHPGETAYSDYVLPQRLPTLPGVYVP